MKFNRAFLFVISLLFILSFSENAICQVTVDPVGITVSMENEDTLAVEMTLTNSGEDDIAYSIDFVEPPEDEERDRGIRTLRHAGSVADPRRDNRGGPDEDDEFAYEWRDNDERDGPEFEWIDIDEVFDEDDIIDIGMGDDTNHGAYDLGFEFTYYGNVYDEIRMCSNGWASFTDSDGGYYWFEEWGEFPTNEGPTNALACALTDWNPDNGGGTYQFASNGDMAVCLWNNIPHYDDGNCRWTFQIVLYPDGLIKYQYLDCESVVDRGLLIGFQNADRDLGHEIFRGNGDYPREEGRAIAFGPPDAWIQWIWSDSDEGIIGAEDEEILEVNLTPIDIEEGVHEMRILIELEEVNGDERDQLEQTLIEISAVMSLASPTADLTGTVTNAANDETIEDAKIAMDAYIIERFTDGDGVYSFTELPLQAYELTFTATDYLPLVEAFDPDEEQEYELDVALLHSECNLDREVINEELPLESETHVGFRVTNNGNGDLDYLVERRLLGGANADPWELRGAYNSSQTLEDERLEGVVFDGENFYIAGSNMWNRVDGDNMIYVVDREGEPVREFVQIGESRYGMKDLAWDGELIWGSGDAVVYGFTTDGELDASFQGPENSNQALAWDPVRGWFWISSITSDITGMDRNGERHGELDRHGFRIYGLAYWLEDPDDCPLYIFHSPGGDVRMVHKMNPDNGDTMFVAQLDPEAGGRSGGAFITNQFDVYSWVFISLINDGNDDQIQIWQLDARKDWMAVDPAEGIIEYGLSTDFDLLLSSRGLPPVLFEGELVFLHNGIGAETHLPISLNVIDENPPQRPPSEFDLLEPVNNDTLSLDSVQTFIWEASIDPDPEDVVSYLIWFQALDDSIWYAVEDTTWAVRPDTLLAGFDLDSPVSWWVDAVSDTDVVECNERFQFRVVLSSVDVSERIIPAEFAIRSVHPNPFNSQATVSYSLNRTGHTHLRVFDFAGREVAGYDYGVKQAGYHSAVIDAGALPSGVYIVQLTSGAEVRQAKMVCIK